MECDFMNLSCSQTDCSKLYNKLTGIVTLSQCNKDISDYWKTLSVKPPSEYNNLLEHDLILMRCGFNWSKSKC